MAAHRGFLAEAEGFFLVFRNPDPLLIIGDQHSHAFQVVLRRCFLCPLKRFCIVAVLPHARDQFSQHGKIQRIAALCIRVSGFCFFEQFCAGIIKIDRFFGFLLFRNIIKAANRLDEVSFAAEALGIKLAQQFRRFDISALGKLLQPVEGLLGIPGILFFLILFRLISAFPGNCFHQLLHSLHIVHQVFVGAHVIAHIVFKQMLHHSGVSGFCCSFLLLQRQGIQKYSAHHVLTVRTHHFYFSGEQFACKIGTLSSGNRPLLHPVTVLLDQYAL